MTWDGKERRQHKRFGVKRLGIHYTTSRLLALITGYSEKYLVLNVSEGGLYFMTKQELPIGTKLAMRLSYENTDTISCSGEVIWMTKSIDHDAYKVGVRFTSLSGRNRRRLLGVLESAVLEKIDVSTSIYLRDIERM